jgi:hypothetical protein
MWTGAFDFAHNSHFDVPTEITHSNILTTAPNATTNDTPPGALITASTLDPHHTTHALIATDSGIHDAFSAAAALLRVQHEPHHQQNDNQLDVQYEHHLQQQQHFHQQSNNLRAVSKLLTSPDKYHKSTMSLNQLQDSMKRVEEALQQGNSSMAIQLLSEITDHVVSGCEYLGKYIHDIVTGMMFDLPQNIA